MNKTATNNPKLPYPHNTTTATTTSTTNKKKKTTTKNLELELSVSTDIFSQGLSVLKCVTHSFTASNRNFDR